MNALHKQRLGLFSLLLLGLSLGVGLMLYALQENINVFLTPTQLNQHKPSLNRLVRLGGLVKHNSVRRDPKELAVTFIITDLAHEVSVHYQGILPDLFREGSGVIAEGQLNAKGHFIAKMVLAKHDENYMPKKIYQQLRANNPHA